MDDSCLRSHPTYRDLFIDKPVEPKPEVHWLAPVTTDGIALRNSRCGLYQVRRSGEPAEYSLFSIRIPPFARLIKGGFKSFIEVRVFLQRSP